MLFLGSRAVRSVGEKLGYRKENTMAPWLRVSARGGKGREEKKRVFSSLLYSGLDWVLEPSL